MIDEAKKEKLIIKRDYLRGEIDEMTNEIDSLEIHRGKWRLNLKETERKLAELEGATQ